MVSQKERKNTFTSQNSLTKHVYDFLSPGEILTLTVNTIRTHEGATRAAFSLKVKYL